MKIYKITNIITNKFYIGKTTRDINRRLFEHFYEARRKNGGSKLYNSILKHGEDNFKIEVLEECDTLDILNRREQELIKSLDSIEHGYNMTIGGDGGFNQQSVEVSSIPVICLNLDRLYKNSREVERDLGIDYKQVWKVCNGLISSAGGYVFEYDYVNLDEILEFRHKRSQIKDIKKNSVFDVKTKTCYENYSLAAKSSGLSAGTVRNHCEGKIYNPRFIYNNIKKSLFIGDWHCKNSNLPDSQKLMSFIINTVEGSDIDSIFFMGDQFDTHGVIDMRVMNFWTDAFKKLSILCPVYVLVGNHDMKGDKETEASTMNSLSVFKTSKHNRSDLFYNITIVDSPIDVEGIGLMPYYKNKNKFLEDCNDLFSKGCTNTLIAHQNFTVSLFGDMIDYDKVPQKHIISGHIHDHNSGNKKVFYTDTPMWLTAIDCNKDKGIWIVEFDELKNIIQNKFISTKDVVTPIVKYSLSEGDVDVVLNPNTKNYLELVGSSAWIIQMKKKYKGLASIKARPSDRKNINTNKDKAFSMMDFLDTSFKPMDGVEKNDIKKYLEEVIYV